MKRAYIAAATFAFISSIPVVADRSRIEKRSLRRSHERRSSRFNSLDYGDAKYLTACIGKYPGYNGNLNVSGDVKLIYTESGTKSFLTKAEELGVTYVSYDEELEMVFQFKLQGLEEDCKNCGIHIHEGMGCEDASKVGGHYWYDSNDEPDPWTSDFGAIYRSNNRGVANGDFSIYNGFARGENRGHVVVVHAEDYVKRIGCGILRYDNNGACDPTDNGEDRISRRSKISKGASKYHRSNPGFSKKSKGKGSGKSSKGSVIECDDDDNNDNTDKSAIGNVDDDAMYGPVQRTLDKVKCKKKGKKSKDYSREKKSKGKSDGKGKGSAHSRSRLSATRPPTRPPIRSSNSSHMTHAPTKSKSSRSEKGSKSKKSNNVSNRRTLQRERA